MRLLLDEHFSPEVARQLRDRGHDALAVRDHPDARGLSDRDVVALATRQRRAVVTENVADIVELHRAAIITRTSHFGLIFTSSRQFPRTRRSIGRLVRALEALLTEHPSTDELRDQTWWLEPARRK